MKNKLILAALMFLCMIKAEAQNNIQPTDLKIIKGSSFVDFSEVGNGLLVDNYLQLVDLITKHNKVELSQEFVQSEKDFFKDNAYYFVPIPTHCNQPVLHNIIPKYVGANKIEINAISVYSGPVCPGAKQRVLYSVIIPKKYLTDKKLEVTIKPQEVFERPADFSKQLNGTWIEAKYDHATKTVEHNALLQKTELIFKNGEIEKVLHTKGAKRNPNVYWFGNYKIENDTLTITYLGFHTADGLQKETILIEGYKIEKLTETELVIYNPLGCFILYKAYLKQKFK